MTLVPSLRGILSQKLVSSSDSSKQAHTEASGRSHSHRGRSLSVKVHAGVRSSRMAFTTPYMCALVARPVKSDRRERTVASVTMVVCAWIVTEADDHQLTPAPEG